MKDTNMGNFESLKEFYPYYLTEHRNSTSKLLHFIGTGLIIIILILGLLTSNYQYLWFVPLVGYGFAWVGHFFFEKNKPATFKHPFYSLASDFIMFFDILRGKVKI
jgi:hypothetical protein